MKTNKSYKKRLKVTRKGKVIGRKSGQNHFNAKESRNKQLNKNRTAQIDMGPKDKSRFLANLG